MEELEINIGGFWLTNSPNSEHFKTPTDIPVNFLLKGRLCAELVSTLYRLFGKESFKRVFEEDVIVSHEQLRSAVMELRRYTEQAIELKELECVFTSLSAVPDSAICIWWNCPPFSFSVASWTI